MITGRAILSNLIGILEGPEDLFQSSESIIFINSSFDVWAIIKSVLILFLRYDVGHFPDLGIVFSVLGPILVKKLLNVLDTSSGLSINLPLVIIWDVLTKLVFFVLTILLIPFHVFFMSCLQCSK